MSQKKKAIRLLTLFLFITVMFGVLYGAVSDMTAYAYDITEFDKTNVMDDLSNAMVDGKPFDVEAYPADPDGDMQLISFIEYCYTYYANELSKFGLYVYIYNPRKLDIATGSESNKIEMGVKHDETGNVLSYSRYSLRFCSKSFGENSGLFYKFKIVDKVDEFGKTIADYMAATPQSRRYDISGFSLFEYGQSETKEYTFGGSFIFTGFAKGCGKDRIINDLDCQVNELETLKLDVHQTFFRPDVMSSMGQGHKNDLHSVYFSVPNNVIERYGGVCEIKADWYEYKTTPIIVTDNNSLFNDLLNNAVGVCLERNQGDITQSQFYDSRIKITLAEGFSGGFAWNSMAYGNSVDYLTYAFYSSKFDDYAVTGDDLLTYIKNYKRSNYKGYLDIKSGRISADLFEDTVDSGRNRGLNTCIISNENPNDYLDLLSYDSTHTKWEQFIHKNFFNSQDSDFDFKDIKPIYSIEPEYDFVGNDENISDKLYINPDEVAVLKNHVSNYSEATTYLFRFAVTDYYSTKLYIDTGNPIQDSKKNAYMASESVFLDFKIIYLKFAKAGTYKVIPVVSDPIDIAGSVTPPPFFESDSPFDKIKELFHKMLDFFKQIGKYLLTALVGIIVILLVIKVLSRIIKNSLLSRKIENAVKRRTSEVSSDLTGNTRRARNRTRSYRNKKL